VRWKSCPAREQAFAQWEWGFVGPAGTSVT
jgi:hypothetical protein